MPYLKVYARELLEQWLERAERYIQYLPLLRAFYNGVLISHLGITSSPLLLAFLLLAALLVLLLAVGTVGAAVEWWLRVAAG